VNKSTSTRLGQGLLDKGLVTAEQLDIAVKEQQKRRQLLDPFDANLGVNSSLGEILIELGFIDRLQLRRGLNWQLMLRKMAIVMSFCAPLMTVSYGAAAASFGAFTRPSFTLNGSSSSGAAKVTPSFTRTSSSASSAPAIFAGNDSGTSFSSAALKLDVLPESSPATSTKSSSSNSSKANSVVSSISKSSAASSKGSGLDSTAPKIPEKISVISALSDQVHLTWIAATDNVAVTRYKIYRDQVQIDTLDVTENSYFDFGVAAGKTYLYGISAGDDAGNWSPVKSVFVQTASIPLDTSGSQISLDASSTASAVFSSASKSATFTPPLSSSVSSSSVSSEPGSIASSSSSAPTSMSSSSSSSSKAAASSNSSSSPNNLGLHTSVVAGPVSFNWTAPNLRENGNTLDITEVGGYELRYRKTSENLYTYISINDAWKNYYNFTWLEGTYIFQIAAFDKNGLYSNFIDLTPH
jgi:hypothetical protein